MTLTGTFGAFLKPEEKKGDDGDLLKLKALQSGPYRNHSRWDHLSDDGCRVLLRRVNLQMAQAEGSQVTCKQMTSFPNFLSIRGATPSSSDEQ